MFYNFMFFKDCRIVHTCGICEEICEVENFKNHFCLEGYNNYIIDENSLYFYPVLGKLTFYIIYIYFFFKTQNILI